ncbi:hypothetical protein B0T26DRAFT_681065 [Lasiosphaeria miniovina]|uniref:Uncharacterized protein n=1 Tax=Lasiosphaeria miniovina TaxID=1954250 RepID=A0AA39ZTJ5_9PEZI|nr:uncharacterized protein B0T26DRAFT_681065 [Lasiosphaeria miniovina]KAK0703382.1 hypothetical protein B0T26DRAFT_681065 [Lasiosphaeria miniovina]
MARYPSTNDDYQDTSAVIQETRSMPYPGASIMLNSDKESKTSLLRAIFIKPTDTITTDAITNTTITTVTTDTTTTDTTITTANTVATTAAESSSAQGITKKQGKRKCLPELRKSVNEEMLPHLPALDLTEQPAVDEERSVVQAYADGDLLPVWKALALLVVVEFGPGSNRISSFSTFAATALVVVRGSRRGTRSGPSSPSRATGERPCREKVLPTEGSIHSLLSFCQRRVRRGRYAWRSDMPGHRTWLEE